MINIEIKQFLIQAILSLSVLGFFIFWVETDPGGMNSWLLEDGFIETLGSLFFGVSSIGFFVVAARSNFLKNKSNGLRYSPVIAWALLMFVFMGEEISWGQRIFGFSTPEGLAAINAQHEFNIHNIEFVNTFMGGKYRYLSIMMITTGLLLPLLVTTRWGRNTIQWWAFPVTPAGYGILFIGAYVFGKYYHDITLTSNDATEIREFLMAVAMMFFSVHGALCPDTLFRVKH